MWPSRSSRNVPISRGITFVHPCLISSTNRLSRAPVSTEDFTQAFWPMIREIVPEASKNPQQCDELLSLCLALFKIAEKSLDTDTLNGCFADWTELLLAHTAFEVFES